ncbi:MAG: metalloregulator ArsR/SmtB family transcription factor [Pseudomonadota bacterium]
MTNETSRHDIALDALADPTRRAILERLRAGPSAVGPLADTLPVSRPAVSQHLKVLCDAGLCQVEPEGNRRIYGLAPGGMDDLRAYIDDLWGDVLGAFARAAHNEERTSRDAR